MVLMPKYGGLAVEAFQELCITAVIAGAVLMILALIGISPSDKPEAFTSQKKEKVGVRDCINLLKRNRAMQMYIISACSDKLALQSASQAAVTTMVFGIEGATGEP